MALTEGQLAVTVLSGQAQIVRRTDLQQLLNFVEDVSPFLPNLRRYNIASVGTTVGLGYTRKYSNGGKMEAFYVRKSVRHGEHATLESIDRQLFKKSQHVSRCLENLLADCFPRALIERLYVTKRYELPLLGDVTSACYVTSDFATSFHADLDEGCCMAIAIFLERHQPGCKNDARGQSCKKNWYFYLPELGLRIKLHHGVVIIWDSEIRIHGTSCSNYSDDERSSNECCVSRVWAIVSQIKTRHLQQKDLIISDDSDNEETD